jgi:thymidylate synthase
MDIFNIRDEFGSLLIDGDFVIDKSGVKTLEIVGTSFRIDAEGPGAADHIFGEPNLEYANRELQWYQSQSLFVKDIPGKTPAIWEQVASFDGRINSNYGYLIYSFDNYSQYANVVETLKNDANSRRGIMIYNRPTMHYDYNRNGMSDFICTTSVQYLIRDGKLHVVVNMRSNDAIFGFRNDYHWQRHVQEKMANELQIEIGPIYWQVGSLHIYERHFYLVDHYNTTVKTSIPKSEYVGYYR